MPDSAALARLRAALAAGRAGSLAVSGLAQALRGESGLLASLPPRYAQVLEDLLGRLESASLFSEESCSFSRRDLFDGLDAWLEQAAQYPPPGGAAKNG